MYVYASMGNRIHHLSSTLVFSSHFKTQTHLTPVPTILDILDAPPYAPVLGLGSFHYPLCLGLYPGGMPCWKIKIPNQLKLARAGPLPGVSLCRPTLVSYWISLQRVT